MSHSGDVEGVKPRDPERKGLPIVWPAAKAGCC